VEGNSHGLILGMSVQKKTQQILTKNVSI